MECPVDGATLTMAERQGVEIDYCPQCRGVWLDRGELDKILDRSAEVLVSPAPPRPAPSPPPPRRDDRYPYGSDDRRRKKRKGWLDEIFDFD